MHSCACAALQPRIPIGEGFLHKDTFFEFPIDAKDPPGQIRCISTFSTPGDQTRLIAICDWTRAYFIDPANREIRLSIPFGASEGKPVPIDVNRDGSPEVFVRGDGFADVRLLNAEGRGLWRRPGSAYPDYALSAYTVSIGSTADLDRDGVPEFYLATSHGLECVAPDGETMWVAGPKNWYEWVDVYDPAGQEQPMVVALAILEGTPQRILEFRGRGGGLIKCLTPPGICRYRLLRWPTEDRPLRLLCDRGASLWDTSPGKIVLLDEDGRGVFAYRLPWWADCPCGVEGTLVRFAEDQPPYFAVLVRFRHFVRYSLLCVFALNGELVYQERLPRTIGLLATRLPGIAPDGEVLLVGDGEGKVSMYTLVPGHSSGPE